MDPISLADECSLYHLLQSFREIIKISPMAADSEGVENPEEKLPYVRLSVNVGRHRPQWCAELSSICLCVCTCTCCPCSR